MLLVLELTLLKVIFKIILLQEDCLSVLHLVNV